VAREFPATFPAFQAAFPDEAECRRYLMKARWPGGFSCPYCGQRPAWERSRHQLLCGSCRKTTSLTAGTILHHSRLPLLTWFWASYLVVTRPGLNSVTLASSLGLTSRETAHALLARLRRAMAATVLTPLVGVVEADEMMVGGVTPGVRGWRVAGTRKRLVLVVVERGTNRTRMEVIADRTGATLVTALTRLVERGSTVVTDGHAGYNGLPSVGFSWRRVPHPMGGLKRGGAGRATPAVDAAISYFRRWLLGTYNKPPADYTPYLAEFCFRAEFRRQPDVAFATLLASAVGG
jgi:transposase-like protein